MESFCNVVNFDNIVPCSINIDTFRSHATQQRRFLPFYDNDPTCPNHFLRQTWAPGRTQTHKRCIGISRSTFNKLFDCSFSRDFYRLDWKVCFWSLYQTLQFQIRSLIPIFYITSQRSFVYPIFGISYFLNFSQYVLFKRSIYIFHLIMPVVCVIRNKKNVLTSISQNHLHQNIFVHYVHDRNYMISVLFNCVPHKLGFVWCIAVSA